MVVSEGIEIVVRIVCTADNHLDLSGKKQKYGARKYDRRKDFRKSFEFIIDSAIECNADLFLHGGDLFDGMTPTNSTRAWTMRQFKRLSDAGISVFVVGGHHDTPRGVTTGVSPLKTHGDSGHIVFFENPSEPSSHTLDVNGQSVQVVGIGFNQTLYSDQNPLDVPIPKPECNLNILLLHYPIIGFSGFIGDEPKIDSKTLPKGYQLVVVGHFHSAQYKKIRGSTVVYPGSSERVDFNEEGGDKSFSVVEVDESGSITVEHMPIETRTLQTETIRISPDDDIDELVRKRMNELGNPEIVFRFRLEGTIPAETLASYHRSSLQREGDKLFFKTFLDEKDLIIERPGQVEVINTASPFEQLMNYFDEKLKEAEVGDARELIEDARQLCIQKLEEVQGR